MTVKETILLAAELLGCGEKVKEYFEEKGETGKRRRRRCCAALTSSKTKWRSTICPCMPRTRRSRIRVRSPIPRSERRSCACWACGTSGGTKFPSGSSPTI